MQRIALRWMQLRAPLGLVLHKRKLEVVLQSPCSPSLVGFIPIQNCESIKHHVHMAFHAILHRVLLSAETRDLWN